MARRNRVLDALVSNIVLRTTLYYVVLFAFARWLYSLPQADRLVKASLDALTNSPVFNGFTKNDAIKASEVAAAGVSPSTLAITTAFSMSGAVLLALPVTWIYTMTRQKRGYDQSVVQTLILLPALVAGVVVLVKYSLALAFSIAGIVAAVRFRTSLDDSKDAVYIFLATAIGMAAGVQLPMAAVLSVMFNLVVLLLWYTEFGKAPPMEGLVAERNLERLEESQARMHQTGTFAAMVDERLFANMTPEQLSIVADRAWRRRRELDVEEVSDEDMQKRDALLRVHVNDPDEARGPVEAILNEFCKKVRFVGVVKEPDGTKKLDYAITLKKSARGADLADALHAKSHVIDAEIK